MKRVTDRKLAHEIADDLRGTAQSFGDVCEDHGVDPDTLTNEEHAIIDDEVFECERCGWWCGTDERFDAETCEECAESGDDDGEE